MMMFPKTQTITPALHHCFELRKLSASEWMELTTDRFEIGNITPVVGWQFEFTRNPQSDLIGTAVKFPGS